MRLRFGLAAWSNQHFDHALYHVGTLHAEYLPRYATLFDCAEADILHHRQLDAATLQQWVEQTPDGFLFLPKLHKDATHGPTMRGGGRVGQRHAWLRPELPHDPAVAQTAKEQDERRTEAFLNGLAPLRNAGRLGPILVQFAPALQREAGWDRLVAILGSAPPGTFAVELRHTSWFVPAVERLLEDVEAPLVWSTYPGAFAPPWRTAGYGYLRFTGKQQKKRGRHVTVADKGKEAREMASRLKEAGWHQAFVIVTNGFEGNAVDSMPKVMAAMGEAAWARRATPEPGRPLFPD